MNGAFLITGQTGLMTAEASGSIQRIADCLAGTGIEAVRLDDLQAAAIHVALRKSRGNRTHAAKLLGISVRTLQRKLKAESVQNGQAAQR
jgi:transcriptional regulator with PAS, ATPase and Fis domain